MRSRDFSRPVRGEKWSVNCRKIVKTHFMKLPKPFTGKGDLVNAIIETPSGSRNKFEFDQATGLFKLSKVLPGGTDFPLDMGFIPGTKAGDGDPLDILLIT